MLHLSLALVVAYEWRAYECELITPCSIVDIVGSESGLLTRFSLQLFKLYFSASIASKLQQVLNSLNSLLEFNYITSFLFLGILKMFCIP